MQTYRELPIELRNSYGISRHGYAESNQRGIMSSEPETAIREHGLVPAGLSEVTANALIAVKNGLLTEDTQIVSTDFLRGRQTAVEYHRVGKCRLPIIYRAELRERRAPKYNGGDPEIFHQEIWSRDLVDPTHKHEGTESCAEVFDRVVGVVLELEQEYTGRSFLFVSHSDPCQITRTGFAGLPLGCHTKMGDLAHATIIKLMR